MANISKRQRSLRPAKPEFAWTGVIIGLFFGWLAAVFVEVGMGKPDMIVMLVGGIVGVLIGFGVEGIRYWWRLRHYARSKKN